MRSFREISCFLFIIAAVTWAGCAVLTESQVKEVGRFAEATRGYEALPGAAVAAYSDVFRTERAIEVASRTISNRDDAMARWDRLREAPEPSFLLP